MKMDFTVLPKVLEGFTCNSLILEDYLKIQSERCAESGFYIVADACLDLREQLFETRISLGDFRGFYVGEKPPENVQEKG